MFALILFLNLWYTPPAHAEPCAQALSETFAVIDLNLTQTQKFPNIDLYRESIRAKNLPIDARLIAKENINRYENRPHLHFLIAKSNLILEHDAQVSALRHWEKIVFEYHLAHSSNWSNEEFEVYFLSKGENHLAVFDTQHEMSVAISAQARDKLHLLLAEGYRVDFHLHNHPIFYEIPNLVSLGGDLAPSGNRNEGDFKFYLDMIRTIDLPEARITNGFETFRIGRNKINAFVNEAD